MNLSKQQRDELFALCLASLGDDFADADRARLESLVLDSASETSAADFYIQFLTLAAGLEWEHALHSDVRAIVRPVRQLSAVSDQRTANKATPHSALLTHHSKLRAVDRFFWRHRAGLGVAAGILFVVTVLTWAAVTYLPQLAGNDEPSGEPAASEAAFVARLANWRDPEWLDGTRPPLADPRLRAGQRLAIDSGLIEIHYNTGAQVVVEGPAEFVVGQSGKRKAESGEDIHHSSPITHRFNSGYLVLGTLVAHCETEEAKGFAIATPQATIVDRGTVFAVSVDANEAVETHVIQGAVEFHKHGAQQAVGAPQALTGGQSATLALDGSLAIQSRSVETLQTRFARFKISEPPAITRVVNVDFDASQQPYAGPGAAPDLHANLYWNSFGHGQWQAAGLLASDGTTRTTIGFSSSARLAGARQEQRIDLLDDYHFQWVQDGPLKLTITGLAPDKTYDIYLFASTAINQGSKFTIGSQTKATAGTMIRIFLEGVNYVLFPDISPTPAGEIVITAADNGGGIALINGFQIVERENPKEIVQPEANTTSDDDGE